MPGNAIAQRLMDLSTDELRRELFASSVGSRSYAEVRDSMLGYAGWLSSAEGIKSGDCIAICLPKTPETVQLIYGVLAAGAAYVPLQYQGPPARLARTLGSLRPALFITTRLMAAALRAGNQLDQFHVRTIEVDGDEASLSALKGGIPSRKDVVPISPQSLAVLFFSSGSTGEPKGVMWSQRTMASTLAALPRWWQGAASDRLISVSGLHYAASFEIFFPVISLASVYLCSDREIFADRLAEVVERERTTIWASTATALRMLVEKGDLPNRDLRALRRVAVFGEPMPIAALRAAMDALPQAEFRNVYSSTEALDMVDYIVPRPLGPEVKALPLGRPTPAYRLSLRDEAGREVKPGEIGEICVVGPAVCAGYWGDPELSAAKRLPGIPASYRTGDLARHDQDGLLMLVGRRDHQVKVRGHRLDLGEIESVARTVPGVRAAVAFIVDADSEAPQIVLAVLTDAIGDKRAEMEGAFKQTSQQSLPSYARPGRIAFFGEFPLLSSGKIDRRGLEGLVAQN